MAQPRASGTAQRWTHTRWSLRSPGVPLGLGSTRRISEKKGLKPGGWLWSPSVTRSGTWYAVVRSWGVGVPQCEPILLWTVPCQSDRQGAGGAEPPCPDITRSNFPNTPDTMRIGKVPRVIILPKCVCQHVPRRRHQLQDHTSGQVSGRHEALHHKNGWGTHVGEGLAIWIRCKTQSR